MIIVRTSILMVASLLGIFSTGFALSADSPRWIDPVGVKGTLFIAGGGQLPDRVLRQFVRLAGREPHLVVIPTASESADDPEHDFTSRWKDLGLESVGVLHTRDRSTADTDDFVAPLSKATAVWFVGGSQSRIAEAYVGTEVEKQLVKLLERGGVIGGTSAGAAIQSKVMIASWLPKDDPQAPGPNIKTGFDLLPDSIIDQHFTQRSRKPRLLKAVAAHPECIGFGIDEGTALIVQGRRIVAAGDASVTVVLAANDHRQVKEIVLKDRQVADLTALRRAARDRRREQFPAPKSKPAYVENGALLIVGGGGMTREMVERFVQKAGGPDQARIVILPVSSPDPRSAQFALRMFRNFRVKHVDVLAQRKKADVESAEFTSKMKKATGVWFGGGRQWHFMDCYEGTKAWPLILDVLKRGGVMGGSSAGASIQAEYMVRGNPLGNTDMMADGYERGMGFLPGTAVDQHFTQRGRHPDLERVIKKFPQLLGIGIDETTSIWVEKDQAEVIGRNEVYFIEVKKETKQLRKQQLREHGVFNLTTREIISAGRPAPPPRPEEPRRNGRRP